MKMQRVNVTFEKSVDVVVYVPVGMSRADIEQAARLTAEGIDRDGWNVDDWATVVGRPHEEDVPDEECQNEMRPNRFGGTFAAVVQGSRLGKDGVMVLDDLREEFVNPEDASWWVADANDSESDEGEE